MPLGQEHLGMTAYRIRKAGIVLSTVIPDWAVFRDTSESHPSDDATTVKINTRSPDERYCFVWRPMTQWEQVTRHIDKDILHHLFCLQGDKFLDSLSVETKEALGIETKEAGT